MVVVVEDLLRLERDTNELRFELGMPISVNHMYANTRGGGKRPNKAAETYIRNSRARINVVLEEQEWELTEKGVWLYIDLIFYFPDRVRRDSHNFLKILLDTLEGKVYQDDMYVMPRIMSVEYDKANPRVEIKIHPQTKELRNLHINDMM